MKVSRISLAYGAIAVAAALSCAYAGYRLLSLSSYYSTVRQQVNQWCHKSGHGCQYAFQSGDLVQPEITLVYRGRVRADLADRIRKDLESDGLLTVSGHPLANEARPIALRAEGQ